MKLSREQAKMCNYIEMTLYNKTKEIENKIAEGRAPETELERFVNVFRTEVKIKNNKLNALKNSGKMTDKLLETYYNDEVTTKLYSSIVEKLFGKNDFFRIDIALDIIEKDEKNKKCTKDKLKKLIKKINRYGYTKAKKYWVNKYSEVTFRNHIKKIEELGINVLTFDRAIDGIELETESMKNFTNLENSIKNKMEVKQNDGE